MRALVIEGSLIPSQMAHWEAVQRHGIDVHLVGTLVGPKQDWWVTTVPDSAVSIHVHQPRGWVRRGSLWWMYPGLPSLIRRLQPDLIHVAAEPWALFYSQLDLRRYPTVGHGADNLWIHGGWLETTVRLRRARSILGRLAGFASWNTAGIEYARRFGLEPDAPTLVVPSRLSDPEPFIAASKDRDRLRSRDHVGGDLVIGFVGQVVAKKGLEWLIEAIAAAGFPNASLQVYGTGRDLGRMEALAARLGVPARFAGGVPAEQVPDAMATLDVLVVPSLTVPGWAEQFGRVALEGMFSGVSVITSDSGALPEVVGDAGIVVPEGDVTSLARELSRLGQDESLRIRLGEAGRARALSVFSPDAIARSLENFWNGVLGVPG